MTHKSKRERKYAATYRAERMDALNSMADNGTADDKAAARKAKAASRDTWVRRQSNNVTGFHNPKPKRDACPVAPARPALATLPGQRAYKVAR